MNRLNRTAQQLGALFFSLSFISLAFLSVSFISEGIAQESAFTEQSMIEKKIPQWLTETDTPSAAIGYIVDGQLTWVAVDGEQSENIKASENTLYNVASLAKPVTAELLFRLIDEQPEFLDAQASTWWIDPDVKDDPLLKQLKIKHLLSHQSGFPNWRYQTDDKLVFNFKPGTAPGYSGEGYQYLAEVIQSKWQQPFEKLMASHLFETIGMDNSAFTHRSWFDERIAHPKGPEGKYGKPSIRETFVAADDLYATITDYSHFVASVMLNMAKDSAVNKARWTSDFNLAPRLCGSGRIDAAHCPDALGFVMGWSRIDYGESTFYLQGGGDWGERAMAIMLPESKTAIVVLTNGANGMKLVRRAVNMLMPHASLDAFLAMQAGE